jgi:hypothetical protein
MAPADRSLLVLSALVMALPASAAEPEDGLIAFDSNRDGAGIGIVVMNPAGSNPIRITNSAGEDRSPSWSPPVRGSPSSRPAI